MTSNCGDKIKQFSIQDLFNGMANYLIPMYQRNYSWDEPEITQLIQDIIDNIPIPNSSDESKPYYLGTLIVFKRDKNYEVIDGQQRLTTLSLLTLYLKNSHKLKHEYDVSWYEELCIDFECRKNSLDTLAQIYKGEIEILSLSETTNKALLKGYKLIETILRVKLEEASLSIEIFCKYLFGKVQIMRVEVPQDTDLNHYFEIMNSRGEQLEKHEILKSYILEVFKDDKPNQNLANTIWEACTNMDEYVQMSFPSTLRTEIFGENRNEFVISDFDGLKEKVVLKEKVDEAESIPESSIDDNEYSIDDIVSKNAGDKAKDDEKSESANRFHSVINFPNFLLHVLKIQINKDISLDDKKLIPLFKEHLLSDDDEKKTRIKLFLFNLLRSKYLYDKYIIKREYVSNTDAWSLKRLFKEKSSEYYKNTFGENDENTDYNYKNRRILMLLAAFHVSAPTAVYKHWLNAALYYLFNTENITADEYLKHMESVARAFMFDRYLSDTPLEYFEIIYENKRVNVATKATIDSIEPILKFGAIRNNFVFNYLDYILWVKNEELDKDKEQDKDDKIHKFEFTFRSSVEHYSPQTPMSGIELEPETLHSFGNLCLISRSKNSQLSNFSPEAKKDFYKLNPYDSIKQCYMMNKGSWGEGEIKRHCEEMLEILVASLETESSK